MYQQVVFPKQSRLTDLHTFIDPIGYEVYKIYDTTYSLLPIEYVDNV